MCFMLKQWFSYCKLDEQAVKYLWLHILVIINFTELSTKQDNLNNAVYLRCNHFSCSQYTISHLGKEKPRERKY